uniref:hypothetical protein n=1 Tax=Brochothrix campestris TaxID=2757 RepID=UPI003D52AE88
MFSEYQQFNIILRYKKRLYHKYCTVPQNWTKKKMESYLCVLFTEEIPTIIEMKSSPVLLFNENMTVLKKEDGYSVGKHWKDGIQWEIHITPSKEIITIITDVLTSENELFISIMEKYPMLKEISTVYKTECWIKNDNFIM